VSWRQLRDGAVAAGILYELLQSVGGYYVGHTLKHASNVYGTFGLVIGLLSWFYLSATSRCSPPKQTSSRREDAGRAASRS
jgi:uncharacterized BrkB/YihY/UPF0761 family membrane protein